MVRVDSVTGKLLPDNRQHVDEMSQAGQSGEVYLTLLRVIADICDEQALGKDTFLVIGGSRDHTSLLATVSQEGRKGYYSALDLVGLSAALKQAL